jgi:hypothetical protein
MQSLYFCGKELKVNKSLKVLAGKKDTKKGRKSAQLPFRNPSCLSRVVLMLHFVFFYKGDMLPFFRGYSIFATAIRQHVSLPIYYQRQLEKKIKVSKNSPSYDEWKEHGQKVSNTFQWNEQQQYN